MKEAGAAISRRAEQAKRRRVRAEKIETVLIVALAGLVLFKGGPVLIGIARGIGEMMMALTRL